MNKEFLKMQKIAGLITESEYKKVATENMTVDTFNDNDKWMDALSIIIGKFAGNDSEYEEGDQEKIDNFIEALKVLGVNITENQIKGKLNEEAVSELDDMLYTKLDKMVTPVLRNNFIDACEAIQDQLAEGGVEDIDEMYQYLVTIMLNQA